MIDKSGVLDPTRMYPRFEARADDQLSLMAEIAVDAARKALSAAGKTPADVDFVVCASANMQRALPGDGGSRSSRRWAPAVTAST